MFQPAAGVELANQVEEPRGGGVEVRGELGDLVAEAVQLGGRLGRGQHGGRMKRHGQSSPLLRRLYTLGFGTPESARSERSRGAEWFPVPARATDAPVGVGRAAGAGIALRAGAARAMRLGEAVKRNRSGPRATRG